MPVLSNFQLRREGSLALGDNILSSALFVVEMNFSRVDSAKDLNVSNIVVGDGDLDVESVREESEAEVFKQVFLEVVDLSGTEVVEALDFV